MAVSGDDAHMAGDAAEESPRSSGFNIFDSDFLTPQATRGPASVSPSPRHAGHAAGQPGQGQPDAPSSFLTPQGRSLPANLHYTPSPSDARLLTPNVTSPGRQPAFDNVPDAASQLPSISSQTSLPSSQEVDMEDAPAIVQQTDPSHCIRVQFLTTKQSLRMASGHCEQVKVVGSLDQLNNWGVGCDMVDRNGAWTFDMLLRGHYTPETVIEFLYKYTAHNARGDQVWESRVSRCRLQLDKLLDHVFNATHMHHQKTKVVFQANGIPPCDDSMDLIIAGSLPSLGSWDLKNARGLRKATAGGTHHTTVFVSGGTRFNYSYFLVRRMRVLFASMPGLISPGSPDRQEDNNGAMLWGSGVGQMSAAITDKACVQLLDEWEHFADGIGAAFQPQGASEGKEPSAVLYHPSNPNPKPLAEQTPAELLEFQQKLAERLQCKVCWENDISTVFLPCGHTCSCWKCAQKMSKCALCRQHITQRIKTYI